MRIPIIKATEELPRIPVTATTEGAGRAAQAVGQLSGVVRDIGLDLAQKQQGIKRARQVVQAEIAMEQANKDIIAKLRLEPNHETYFEDWLNEFEFASTDMLIKAKGPKTKAVMEQALSRIATREARRQKDYANQLWLETEQTEVAKALQGCATEGRYDDGIKLIDSVEALYGPKELLALKNNFKTSYDKVQKELADVAADQAIIKNAKQAAIDLKNKDYLPNLEPMQRQDKIEKAKAAAKILENEQEQKLKEAEKQAHDQEEREIGNKFLTSDYKDAFGMVLRSRRLTGDEKRTWNNAIEKASKTDETKLDPTVQALEIIKANDMISRGIPPEEIRAFIARNPNLKKEDREQYIGKLEAKLGAEIDEGRKLGYTDIKDIIIPKRGLLTALRETPLETKAVKDAQMALDEWINGQKQQGKTPTLEEIRKKAQTLAVNYQVPLHLKILEMKGEAERQKAEMLKLKEIEKGRKK